MPKPYTGDADRFMSDLLGSFDEANLYYFECRNVSRMGAAIAELIDIRGRKYRVSVTLEEKGAEIEKE